MRYELLSQLSCNIGVDITDKIKRIYFNPHLNWSVKNSLTKNQCVFQKSKKKFHIYSSIVDFQSEYVLVLGHKYFKWIDDMTYQYHPSDLHRIP